LDGEAFLLEVLEVDPCCPDVEPDVVVVDLFAGCVRLVVGSWESSFLCWRGKVKCFMGGARGATANWIFWSFLILAGMGNIAFLLSQNFYLILEMAYDNFLRMAFIV
jgi:hypothetical protein